MDVNQIKVLTVVSFFLLFLISLNVLTFPISINAYLCDFDY